MEFEDVLSRVKDFLWVKVTLCQDDSEEDYTYMLGQLYNAEEEKVQVEDVFHGASIYDYTLDYREGWPELKLWIEREDFEEDDGM